MARLFVAVRVPVEGLHNPHVTLCFLGDVAGDLVPTVADALRRALEGRARCEAVVEAGTPRRLGPTAIVRPVTGLDELARAVRAAVGDFAARPEDRPFRGHLTVARHRRGEPAPSDGQGVRSELRWLVEEVVLVRSELGRGPGGTARHEDVAVVPLVGSS